MKITETYRPNSFSQVIAQTTSVRQIQSCISRNGYAGSSFWLTGETGTGKTTLAQIMANEFCSDNEFTITEVIGRDVTVEFVRDYDKRMNYKPMGTGRCLIINEAQDLSDSVVSLLLALVEKINRSAHDMIIFTAMVDVLEIKNDPMNRWRALQGRCSVIELADSSSPLFRQDVVEYLEGVAAQEGIRGADIIGFCEKACWSIRQALNLLDMCERTDASVDSEETVPVENIQSSTHDVPACFLDMQGNLVHCRECFEPGLHVFPGIYALPVEDVENTECMIQAELDSQESLPISHFADAPKRSSRTERIYVHQFVFIKESWEHWTQRETENLKTVLLGLAEYPNERTFSQGRMVFEFAEDGRTGEILTRGRIQQFLIERACPADMIRRRLVQNETLEYILCPAAQDNADSTNLVPVETEEPAPQENKQNRLVKRYAEHDPVDSNGILPTEKSIRQAEKRITERFTLWAQNITKAIACW